VRDEGDPWHLLAVNVTNGKQTDELLLSRAVSKARNFAVSDKLPDARYISYYALEFISGMGKLEWLGYKLVKVA